MSMRASPASACPLPAPGRAENARGVVRAALLVGALALGGPALGAPAARCGGEGDPAAPRWFPCPVAGEAGGARAAMEREGAAEVGVGDAAASEQPGRAVARPLPAAPVWEDPVADSRAPRSQVTLHVAGSEAIDATIGLPVPIVEVAWGDARLHVGLAAAIYLGFAADGPLIFDFETFDGWFALPIDLAVGPWSARLEWAHLSAHYGDGVRDNPVLPSNFDAYSREWVRLWGARRLGPARLYASAWALLHTLPDAPPLGVSGGAEIEGPWRFAPYAAVDARLAQEDGWAPAVGAQVGGRAVSGTHRMRLGLAGRVGPEDTGKLRPATEAWLGILLSYDRVEARRGAAGPADRAR